MLQIEPHDLKGHQIGKYKFLERIGRGGMAFVYRGEYVGFDVPIAIKVLFHKHSRSAEKRARFQREAQLQFRLRHNNLVRSFDLIDEQGILGIAMDWVEGQDLATYALKKNGRIELTELKNFFLPVLDVVHYAHKNGIVHRDLKPSNILLEGNPGREVPKVLDFGIAKLLNDTEWKTEEGVLLGTPAYLSPEQAEQKEVDHRADIYALGITFYQLATGQLPFSGDTVLEILMAHRDKEPLPMRFWDPEIPGSLDYVIKKALAKTPEERFPDCESFADALSAAYQDPHYPYISSHARAPEDDRSARTEISIKPHDELLEQPSEENNAISEENTAIPDLYKNLRNLIANKNTPDPTTKHPGFAPPQNLDLDITWVNESPNQVSDFVGPLPTGIRSPKAAPKPTPKKLTPKQIVLTKTTQINLASLFSPTPTELSPMGSSNEAYAPTITTPPIQMPSLPHEKEEDGGTTLDDSEPTNPPQLSSSASLSQTKTTESSHPSQHGVAAYYESATSQAPEVGERHPEEMEMASGEWQMFRLALLFGLALGLVVFVAWHFLR
ncbi:MAG: serine/threonine protein kinase [Myxococcales bacterium]|nr:serine/threonine protein kinase [Myxococcales bacterium]